MIGIEFSLNMPFIFGYTDIEEKLINCFGFRIFVILTILSVIKIFLFKISILFIVFGVAVIEAKWINLYKSLMKVSSKFLSFAQLILDLAISFHLSTWNEVSSCSFLNSPIFSTKSICHEELWKSFHFLFFYPRIFKSFSLLKYIIKKISNGPKSATNLIMGLFIAKC